MTAKPPKPPFVTDPTPAAIDFPQWIEEHRAVLRPPVNNKVIWPVAEDFIVQVVGGPNKRTDFHVDPFEEWFYQIKGDVYLEIMTEKGRERVDIPEGHMFLLPRNVRHSPQRPPNSIGLVVERVRPEGQREKAEWYCRNCENLLHEIEFRVTKLDEDLTAGIEAFAANEDARTCDKCGEVYELPS
jgi:3-hydroxyanthranilate 3,4-dioxygenase